MELKEFRDHIKKAVDGIPDKFKKLLENISIEVDPEQFLYTKEHHLILGTYNGVPFPHRGPVYQGVLPDKIVIYKKAFENFSEAELPELIKNVLMHEVGHYFGLSDEEMGRAI